MTPRLLRRACAIASSSRGLPISTGWNNAAAAIVVSSEIASSLPMLDVPGWLENHRLPNAVAVVQALKRHRARQHRLQQIWSAPRATP